MNQILLTNNQNNRKKSNNYNRNNIDTRKIILFFSIAIIVFGIIIVALYGYKLYQNNNAEEVIISKPNLSIEETENNITIIASSNVGINTITYIWNDEEPQEIQMNGRTSHEEQIEIPEGENILNVKVVDLNGQENETTKTFNREENSEKPTIELDETIGNGKLKITATDNNGIKYITYTWNDEDPTTVESSEEGQTKIETEIDVKRGKNTLKVTAVNSLDNEATTEKIFEGVNKPLIEVVKDRNKLHMKMSHDMGFKKIEFLINGVTYVYDENFSGYDSAKKEIEYQTTLKEGENTVIIVATSMEDTQEIFRGKCTYNPE